jgi:hypothetical protein
MSEYDIDILRRSDHRAAQQRRRAVGVQFIEENNGGPGVRLRKPMHAKAA